MAPSPTIRRLLKETSELSSSSKNPNPAFQAAPVSDNDLHEWHFTLLGPPSPSPYAGGLYHGRISLPPSYPLKPPNFRFLTPSGRFEVNREICLSISGFHEETWMPAWGVRTALTALRSFMAESGTAGQVGGLEASKEVRERLARESRTWKCKECGSRSNEEVMSEWWEACASKGVKVGEDVGLEVLPEGLSLEAKIPGGKEDKGKARETTAHEEVVSATTQAILNQAPVEPISPSILHEKQVEREQQRSDSNNTTQPEHTPSSPPRQSHPSTLATEMPQNRTPATSPMPATPQTPTRTSNTATGTPLAQPPQQRQHQHTTSTSSLTSTSSNSASRAVPPGLRPLPIVDPPLLRQLQERQEQHTSLTIDRAIYVVFLALCIMILKKIFYPASYGRDLDDWAMVKE